MNNVKLALVGHRAKKCSVILFLFVAGCSLAQEINSKDTKMAVSDVAKTRVVLLGTGTPNPTPDRWGPAVAVIAGNKAYMVDAGVGIVRRAAAAAAKHDIDALLAERLDTVFLTHLHSDHTLGLPDLLLTPWTMGRETPLKIYGPQGAEEMASRVRGAFVADIEMRVEGAEPANNTGHQVDVVEIAEGEVYKDDSVTVEAISVEHGSWKYAYGFKFTTSDRTIVISGDTGSSEAVIDAANGVDILVHEVYSTGKFQERPPEWQRYHAAFHTSTVELAEVARRAKPKLLVLYHQLDWGMSDEEMIAEIRDAGYEGKVVSAKDLDIF